VADATFSVDVTDLAGRRWPADEVHAVSLALLGGEYAEVVTADSLLQPGRPAVPASAEPAGSLVVR
jgi:hypothetical protein